MYAECLLGTLVVLIAKQYQWKTLPLKIKKAWSFSFLSISLESGIPFTEDPTKDMQPYNVHWTTFASESLPLQTTNFIVSRLDSRKIFLSVKSHHHPTTLHDPQDLTM